MKKDVIVPSVGESISTGVIVSWIKHSGDKVQEGENLFELETDKAVLEIPSPGSGILEILIEEGKEVQIGQTVATLSDSDKPEIPKEQPEPVKETINKETARDATSVKAPPLKKEEQISQPPSAAPAAETTKKPVTSEHQSKRVPMSPIRKRTAERLVTAMQNSAYITTFNEIDMQTVSAIRQQYKEQFQKEHGIKIGYMSFFVKACVQALKEFPSVNTQVDGSDIIYKYFYDIGIAVSIE